MPALDSDQHPGTAENYALVYLPPELVTQIRNTGLAYAFIRCTVRGDYVHCTTTLTSLVMSHVRSLMQQPLFCGVSSDRHALGLIWRLPSSTASAANPKADTESAAGGQRVSPVDCQTIFPDR